MDRKEHARPTGTLAPRWPSQLDVIGNKVWGRAWHLLLCEAGTVNTSHPVSQCLVNGRREGVVHVLTEPFHTVWGEGTRGKHQVSFLDRSLPYILRQSLSLSPKLMDWLAGWLASEILQCSSCLLASTPPSPS